MSAGGGSGRPPASSENARHTMQANRGKNTRPEMELRRLLREAGFPGYRLHWKRAPGRPDVAYPGRQVAVFVNGCYWHRCPTCRPPAPKANADFWEAKFVANEARDSRQVAELEAAGWSVITVWECELRTQPATVVGEVTALLRSERKSARR